MIENSFDFTNESMAKDNIGIRYAKDGDIETYDPKNGETIGHISTMGNMIEETKEDRERHQKLWEEAMRKNGFNRVK